MKLQTIALSIFALVAAASIPANQVEAAGNLPDLFRQPNDWSRIRTCTRRGGQEIEGHRVARIISERLTENLNFLYQYSGSSAPLILYAEADNQALVRQINAEVENLNRRIATEENRLNQQLAQMSARSQDLPFAQNAIAEARAKIQEQIGIYKQGVAGLNGPINSVIASAKQLDPSSPLGAELRRIERDHRQEVRSLLNRLEDRCEVTDNGFGTEARNPGFPQEFQGLLRPINANYYQQIDSAFNRVYGTPLTTARNERAQKSTNIQRDFTVRTQGIIQTLNTDVRRATTADRPAERAFCSAANLASLNAQRDSRIAAQQALLAERLAGITEKAAERQKSQDAGAKNQVTALVTQLQAALAAARGTYASNPNALSALNDYEQEAGGAIGRYENQLEIAMDERVKEEKAALDAATTSNAKIIDTHKTRLTDLIAKAGTDCAYSDTAQLQRKNPNASRDYRNAVRAENARYASELKASPSSSAVASRIGRAQRTYNTAARAAQNQVRASLKSARDTFRAAVRRP